MQFKEWLSVAEARFKGLKRAFDQEHPNMPPAARDDIYHSRVAHLMSRQLNPNTIPGTGSPVANPNAPKQPMMGPSQIMDRAGFRNDSWQKKPEILKNKWGKEGVTPADFDEKTQWYFIDRRFGFREEKQIRNDKQRTDTQRQLATYKPEGKNEPVIVRQTNNGIQLLEGWHRTMSLLLRGCPQNQLQLLQNDQGYAQDFDLTVWKPVKIQAFVANGQQRDDNDSTGEYVPGQSLSGTAEYTPQDTRQSEPRRMRGRSIDEPVGQNNPAAA